MPAFIGSYPMALRHANDGLPRFDPDAWLPRETQERLAEAHLRASIFRLRAQGLDDYYIPRFLSSVYGYIHEQLREKVWSETQTEVVPSGVVEALRSEAEQRELDLCLLRDSLIRSGLSPVISDQIANLKLRRISELDSIKNPRNAEAREKAYFRHCIYGPTLLRLGMQADVVRSMLDIPTRMDSDNPFNIPFTRDQNG